MTSIDNRPFRQRASLEEMKGCHALTRNDDLVVIVEWERTAYWGGKTLRVREAKPGASMSWLERDEDLTPAFPGQPDWLGRARALRATREAEHISRATRPTLHGSRSRRI